MAELLYQGHGSYRITSDEGKVIYVDPYAGEGYDEPADLILVTHDHFDHNRVDLIKKRKKECIVYTQNEAITPDGYATLETPWVKVTPVKAQNKNHDPKKCVGYIIEIDGVTVWASGDTSMYQEMAELKSFGIKWAFLPTDGKYNMGPDEAAVCAEMCGAKYSVPIHTDLESIYDPKVAEKFSAPNRVLVPAGETIKL